MKTKEKILMTSIELFNKHGVVAVTTNHIAKDLDISPGNLYFHFENKEEIIRYIFKSMTHETYKLWRLNPRKKTTEEMLHPLELIEKNFELFWKYRFFHRELFYLRTKDAKLSKMWKEHITKILKMMTVLYRHWLKVGWMSAIRSKEEINFIVNVLLATASTFLQFFESTDQAPNAKHILNGKKYVARLLVHYTQGQIREDFHKFIEMHEVC